MQENLQPITWIFNLQALPDRVQPRGIGSGDDNSVLTRINVNTLAESIAQHPLNTSLKYLRHNCCDQIRVTSMHQWKSQSRPQNQSTRSISQIKKARQPKAPAVIETWSKFKRYLHKKILKRQCAIQAQLTDLQTIVRPNISRIFYSQQFEPKNTTTTEVLLKIRAPFPTSKCLQHQESQYNGSKHQS